MDTNNAGLYSALQAIAASLKKELEQELPADAAERQILTHQIALLDHMLADRHFLLAVFSSFTEICVRYPPVLKETIRQVQWTLVPGARA